MSDDEKKYTLRDMVLAQREAFSRGAFWRDNRLVDRNPDGDVFARKAAELFPLPKVVRPRVVTDSARGGQEWRVVDGELEWRLGSYGDWLRGVGSLKWERTTVGLPTAARVAIWADLLANPTEEVEAGS